MHFYGLFFDSLIQDFLFLPITLTRKDHASGLEPFLMLVVLIPIVCSQMLSAERLQPHLSSWEEHLFPCSL